MNPLVGPLTPIETRRLTARPWMFWGRLASALVGSAICALVAFVVWVSAQSSLDASLGILVRGSLFGVSLTMMLATLLVSPALLAGALAGEKDQGTLGLLLIARLSSWDVVVGRLLPRLSQVGFLLLGVLMALAYLAGLNSFGLHRLALLALLLASVGVGAGGLALATSVFVRRGRDALMSVFAIYVVALIALSVGRNLAPGPAWGYVNWIDPFAALWQLCVGFRAAPALIVSAAWCLLGLTTTLLATWQLRPAYLRHLATEAKRGGGVRFARRLAIGNRPMLWKELFVERTAALGRIGAWLTWTLVGFLLIGSLGLAALIIAVEHFGVGTNHIAQDARWMLGSVIAATAAPMSWLVQWAIGLRAAVSVASERQRHTWDSLLTSPLQGREIILGKFGGSLYALRWLLGSVVLSWVVAAAFGEFGLWQLFVRVLETLLGAALVAAVGVQFSLLNTSAARAMAYTLGIWLAAAIGTTIVAGVGTVVLLLMTISVLLVVSLVWETLAGSPLNIVAGQVFGAYFSFLYLAVETTIYVTATVSIVGWLARNFDRMAGRGWKRSPPERPVWVDSTGKLAVLPTTD